MLFVEVVWSRAKHNKGVNDDEFGPYNQNGATHIENPKNTLFIFLFQKECTFSTVRFY